MNIPVIIRNGVSLTLTATTFGKKSDNKGKTFYVPTIDVNNPDHVTWAGVDNINEATNRNFRAIFADILLDNVNDDGSFNEENYLLECADFTAGVAKLSTIEDELDELQAEQQNYALSEQFGETDAEGKLTDAATELQTKIAGVAGKIKPLRIMRAAIQAKYAVAAEKRAAKKAAKEAKEKAAAVGVAAPAAA